MSKRNIGILLVALALLPVITAASRNNQDTDTSVWAFVYFETGNRPCSGLANYFEPCPECRVWIRWPEPAPGEPERPLRLDGYVTDEPGHCQVFNVTKYVTCYK